ncbi:MAG: cobyric acid synthase [Muribaculaceae bacterium]|nr:cobyric acid synthase [Muribaculaceae bacterium]
MKRLSPIMLAGTGSDVGKSLIATGLCRIFKQDGRNPAPFKAQNMALNSYVTPDGLEIGRAQAVQAEAAGLPCIVEMNPILLKPSGEHTSQVVLNGKPSGNRDAYSYFRKEGKEELRAIAHQAFDRLAGSFNPIVMEGAGSISELNLRDGDIVNMSMARYAHAKVILVSDIDRGGVFASVYGSIMLQTPADRKCIKGIIINKFRGDLRLFDDGRKIMEDICGVPVLGVVPMASHIHIDEEDSVALGKKGFYASKDRINVAVVLLKHISNFTDFNILERHPHVNLFYTAYPEDLDDADIIILPGSKNTLADLLDLRKRGVAKTILEAREKGKTVIGICGGYQMMGKEVCDLDGIEGDLKYLPGLGLLPIETVMSGHKTTKQVKFRFMEDERTCEGYEIHMGRTETSRPFIWREDGTEEGCMVDERCFGSYIHGILDNAAVIDFILKPFLNKRDTDYFDPSAYRQRQYDLLADWLREYVDIPRIYKIMTTND